MEQNEKLCKMIDSFVSLPRETEWLEFKENFYEKEKIWKYVSALSNSANLSWKQYWYLVRWIKDETHEVIGTSMDIRDKKEWSQDFLIWLMQHISPKVEINILEVNYNWKKVIIMQIAAAILNPTLFDKLPYVRIQSSIQPLANYPDLERKIWHNIWSFSFESQPALKDIEEDYIFKLLDINSYYNLLEQTLPQNRNTMVDHFVSEWFLIKNLDWTYDITNLWAILFAKDLSYFWRLSEKWIRVIKYNWLTKESWAEREWVLKWFALDFWNLIEYIVALSPGVETYLENWFRDNGKIPTIAIREIVANALIHQDFLTLGTGPMVEIFDNRIEVSNPWAPMIDTDRFLDFAPTSRNDKLAKFMRRIKIWEQRWSWIDKVLLACERSGFSAPNFKSWEWLTRVTLSIKKEFSSMTETEKMDTLYWHTCLKYIGWGTMTNASLRERFWVDDNSIISRLIKNALEKQLIKSADPDNSSKKHTRYIPYWW